MPNPQQLRPQQPRTAFFPIRLLKNPIAVIPRSRRRRGIRFFLGFSATNSPLALLLVLAASAYFPAHAQETKETLPERAEKPAKSKSSASPNSAEEDLQRAIQSAGNDSAALVRNLEAYLQQYPDSPRRPQIYRALVEAELQLRDNSAAAGYAERILALSPDDMSMTLLAIQLVERGGDLAALKRATSYATRLLDQTARDNIADKSPRVSPREWEEEHRRLRMTLLFLRGRLNFRLNDRPAARADFQSSYLAEPNRGAAEKLGELAELDKDLPAAIEHYARAFLLAAEEDDSADRLAIRRKLGNVWKQAHGSEDGLGAFLLNTYDALSAANRPAPEKRNPDAHDPYDFKLRRVAEGPPLDLSTTRGKVIVMNFWATWCGPCRELEPHYARVAAQFLSNANVLFLTVNADEDETLVAPYLDHEKSRLTAVFADGLDSLLAVNSFPTVIVLDRQGKISFRTEGEGNDDFETSLSAAVQSALAH
ncbi:MAG: TlpA family protein disulfide reductase [Acidobacteriia bacterium]|nr:TlpA family protein disulfide reductase [Terriglobia bacterium]